MPGAPGYHGMLAYHYSLGNDLVRAEEELRESEGRFRTFVDHATDAFFLHDDRLLVIDVNRQACASPKAYFASTENSSDRTT